MREPDIIWENDDLKALFLVYNSNTCSVVHIVFDLFPFEDKVLAVEILSSFAALIENDIEEHIVFVANLEDDIEELTELVACVILELSKYQDEWLLMNPIERLELFGKVLND